MAKSDDAFKEKFRPPTTSLDQEIEAALAGVSLDELYEKQAPAPARPVEGGGRRGKILSVTPDDAIVDLGGKTQGLAPMAQFETEPRIGEEYDFVIDRFDDRSGMLLVSRKGSTATNVSWDNLEVGQIVEGTVTGSNKGGLEVDVRGMRAFMPAGQVDLYFHPDIAQFVNQRVKAEVTQFSREGRNLIISRRNVLEREKEEAKGKLMQELAEGQVRRGVVRNVMDYGAFIDLGGVDGLLHVSEMTFRRSIKPSEIVKAGDVLDVKITKFDRETGKMSLSLNQARGVDPWLDAETKYAVGSQVTGRVTKVESFGAFIEVEEGVEGLLPVSEISWQRVKHPSDVVKEGDTVRLVVLSVDPTARRMSFSLKQAGPDPWKTVNERYATDMVVNGTITRTADFGAFVELEPGLEGLVHISELSEQSVRQVADAVKLGESVQVRILSIDPEGRRVSLSIKGAVGAMGADAAGATAPANKKKRPQLRGGLDL